MAVFNEPTKWQTSLVNSGDANVIPQSTPVGTGEASFDDGFPQITQIPIGAGGIAPDRKDFNGLFKILGDWIFFNQNGGLPTYSADFDYVAGRVVSYNNNIYKCIQANGASSTVVAPDSVDPVGSDYWGLLLTSSDLSSFANTDLSNLSASGQAIIDGKADKDFSNVTNPGQDFKNMSISWNIPDYSVGIAITSSPFTAPSDGVINANGVTAPNIGDCAYLYINGTQVGAQNHTENWVESTSSEFIIGKGDVFTYSNVSGTLTFFPYKGAN